MAADFDVNDALGKALTLIFKALVLCGQAGLELIVMLLKDAFMMLEEGEEVEGWGRKRKTHSFYAPVFSTITCRAVASRSSLPVRL